jgi:hypothetical protein
LKNIQERMSLSSLRKGLSVGTLVSGALARPLEDAAGHPAQLPKHYFALQAVALCHNPYL